MFEKKKTNRQSNSKKNSCIYSYVHTTGSVAEWDGKHSSDCQHGHTLLKTNKTNINTYKRRK